MRGAEQETYHMRIQSSIRRGRPSSTLVDIKFFGVDLNLRYPNDILGSERLELDMFAKFSISAIESW
jgi:hypothetical protein